MNGLVGYGGQAEKAVDTLSSIRPLSMTERLQQRKVRLEEELAQVNTTLKMLEENPQTQLVLDHLSKLNFGF